MTGRTLAANQSVLQRVTLFASYAMGVALIIAGIGKILDMTSFAREIESILLSFGWEGSRRLVNLSGVAAVAVVISELVCGAMLISGWQRKTAAVVSVMMMSLFIGVIIWGSSLGVIEECGCFGALANRSPLLAIVEDVAFICLSGLAFFSLSSQSKTAWKAVAGVFVAGVVGMFTFTFFSMSWGVLKVGDKFPANAATPPLDFPPVSLLWILNPECPDCVGKTGMLNYIGESAHVQAITDASEGRIREYQWDYQPEFLLSRMSGDDLQSLRLPTGCVLLLKGEEVSQIFRVFELDSALTEKISKIKQFTP